MKIIYNKKAVEKQYKQEDICKNTMDAIKEFGTTKDCNLAGYLLTDGTMLDFSEGQGYRIEDHRAINRIMDVSGYNEGLIRFMNYGNIRMSANGIDISVPPTRMQKVILSKHIKNVLHEKTDFYLDISNAEGLSIESHIYHLGDTPNVILDDINAIFDKYKDFIPIYDGYNVIPFHSITKAKHCGGDEMNYFTFYTGDCYKENSIENIIKFARKKFPDLQDLSDDEIKDNHIYWATDSIHYEGFYNGDEYVVFNDINKLPEDIRIDALNHCPGLKTQEITLE